MRSLGKRFDSRRLVARLAAADADETARALGEWGFVALEHGEIDTLERALATLDDETLARHPAAMALRGALAARGESFDLAEAWFGMALRAAAPAERRAIVLRYATELVRRGRPDAVGLLESETARDVPRVSADDDAALWALLATAYAGVQTLDRARTAARRALRRLPAVADETVRVRVLHQAAYVALASRRYGAAKRLAERALAGAEAAQLHDLAARALSVIVNVAWLCDEDVAAARAGLARLEAAARRAGNESVRLYAMLNAFAIEVDAGNTSALDRLTSELSAMQLLMTRAVTEALLPAQALRAAWNAEFAHAYELLAPGAPKLADPLRAAYRWAEVAVYAAAARRAPEARAAIAASHERLAGVAPAQPLAIRAVAYRALAETLAGDAAAAARTIAEARRLAARAPARGRALVAAIAALVACRRDGARRFRDLAAALDALDAHALGGVARLLARLPVEAIERTPRWEPAVLGAAG